MNNQMELFLFRQLHKTKPLPVWSSAHFVQVNPTLSVVSEIRTAVSEAVYEFNRACI